MKKIIMAIAMATLLSGCQVLDIVQGKMQKPSSIELPKEEPKAIQQANPLFQKLDAQFERMKEGGQEITFNNEKFIKKTLAVKGNDTRFVSVAVSVDRNNRKTLSSDTIYLKNVAQEPEIVRNYLDEIKKSCEPMLQTSEGQEYYECNGNEVKSLVAVISKQQNILAFRSIKFYQQRPTEAEEKAVVKALVDYPLDTIAR